MPVTPGHFTLTPEQRHFKKMLDAYPRLLPYWDFERRSCDLDAINKDYSVLSYREKIMLQFFTSIWLGENSEFDLIDAAKSLDTPELDVIRKWLANPVFP